MSNSISDIYTNSQKPCFYCAVCGIQPSTSEPIVRIRGQAATGSPRSESPIIPWPEYYESMPRSRSSAATYPGPNFPPRASSLMKGIMPEPVSPPKWAMPKDVPQKSSSAPACINAGDVKSTYRPLQKDELVELASIGIIGVEPAKGRAILERKHLTEATDALNRATLDMLPNNHTWMANINQDSTGPASTRSIDSVQSYQTAETAVAASFPILQAVPLIVTEQLASHSNINLSNNDNAYYSDDPDLRSSPERFAIHHIATDPTPFHRTKPVRHPRNITFDPRTITPGDTSFPTTPYPRSPTPPTPKLKPAARSNPTNRPNPPLRVSTEPILPSTTTYAQNKHKHKPKPQRPSLGEKTPSRRRFFFREGLNYPIVVLARFTTRNWVSEERARREAVLRGAVN